MPLASLRCRSARFDERLNHFYLKKLECSFFGIRKKSSSHSANLEASTLCKLAKCMSIMKSPSTRRPFLCVNIIEFIRKLINYVNARLFFFSAMQVDDAELRDLYSIMSSQLLRWAFIFPLFPWIILFSFPCPLTSASHTKKNLQ